MIIDSGNGGTSVSGDDVLKELKRNSLGLIDKRTAMLESMQATWSAKERGLQRERKRLAARLPADSPRLAELDARIRQSQAISLSLQGQIHQAKTPIPAVDSTVWTVFGSVRDGGHNGLPGLAIAFYDEKGNRRDDLGYACTDASGYFTIRSAPNQSYRGAVYLRVHDSSGKILYKDSVAMTPKLGAVDYREIVIDGGSVCTPPWEPPSRGGATGPPATIIRPPERGEREHEPAEHVALPWIVRGRVVDAAGAPAAGMIVTLWDKDLVFDDRLGQAETNERGEYELRYSADTFRDFFERKPDVYVRVSDRAGKRRAQTKKLYRPEAGQVEIVDITLSK